MEGSNMLLLAFILTIESVAFYMERKGSKRGIKLIFSLSLALLIAIVIEGVINSLLMAKILEGVPLIIVQFILTPIVFGLFQALLYSEKQ